MTDTLFCATMLPLVLTPSPSVRVLAPSASVIVPTEASVPSTFSAVALVSSSVPPLLNPPVAPIRLAPPSAVSPFEKPVSVPAVMTLGVSSEICPVASSVTAAPAAVSPPPPPLMLMVLAEIDSAWPPVLSVKPLLPKTLPVASEIATAPVVVMFCGSTRSAPALRLTVAPVMLPDTPVRSTEPPASSVVDPPDGPRIRLWLWVPSLFTFSTSAPVPALIRPLVVRSAVVVTAMPPAPLLANGPSVPIVLTVEVRLAPPVVPPVSVPTASVPTPPSLSVPDWVTVSVWPGALIVSPARPNATFAAVIAIAPPAASVPVVVPLSSARLFAPSARVSALAAETRPSTTSPPLLVRDSRSEPVKASMVPMLFAPVSVAAPDAEPLSTPAVIAPLPASSIVPAETSVTPAPPAFSALPLAERSMALAVTASGLPPVFSACPPAEKTPVVPRLMSTGPDVVRPADRLTSPPACRVTELALALVIGPELEPSAIVPPARMVLELPAVLPICRDCDVDVNEPVPASITPARIRVGSVICMPPAPALAKPFTAMIELAVPASDTPPVAVPERNSTAMIPPALSVNVPDRVVVRSWKRFGLIWADLIRSPDVPIARLAAVIPILSCAMSEPLVLTPLPSVRLLAPSARLIVPTEASVPSTVSAVALVSDSAPPLLKPPVAPIWLAPPSAVSPPEEPLSVPAVMTAVVSSEICPVAFSVTPAPVAASPPLPVREMLFAVIDSACPPVLSVWPPEPKSLVVPSETVTGPVVAMSCGSVNAAPALRLTVAPVMLPDTPERSTEPPASSVVDPPDGPRIRLWLWVPSLFTFSTSAPLPALIRPLVVRSAVVVTAMPPAPLLTNGPRPEMALAWVSVTAPAAAPVSVPAVIAAVWPMVPSDCTSSVAPPRLSAAAMSTAPALSVPAAEPSRSTLPAESPSAVGMCSVAVLPP